jgi:glycosyltransferase involved in cell wall biosynthesis
MKVLMINDCAYVGETLLKYMPPNLERQHIKRTRGLWSKTLGITYKIVRAHGDIFHAHYLLQDCYIAARFGKKPLIGHAHGSDLRAGLKHPLWSRIVRHNLKNCDRVLVSTPDVLDIAKTYREDAEYFPNPVDTELFYPKPVTQIREKKRVLIASDSNWKVKGTDVAIRALGKIKGEVETSIIRHGVDFDRTVALASSLNLLLQILPKVPHDKLNEYYWNADIVIDRFNLGSLGLISLEAIACGRPVLTYASSKYSEYRNFPLVDLNSENDLANAVLDTNKKLWEREYEYLEQHHRPERIVENLLVIYEDCIKGK